MFAIVYLGTEQNSLGTWGRCKRPWSELFFFFFFTALKHGADTFFAVSGYVADTFFHYHETKEKLFTDKNAVAALFFTEVADNH